MRILMAGGGSGGHVTPLKAVTDELRKISHENVDITVVTDHGFYQETRFIFKEDDAAELKKIFSGKFRRYHSKTLLWHFAHLPTLLKNIRDILYIFIGTVQSVGLFIKQRPDVVFCKGGHVCVPIGVAARLFGVKLVIHDSDTRPGLTNLMLAKWAKVIATGMPASFYPYPKDLMVYTGIPVAEEYRIVTETRQNELREQIGAAEGSPLLLVTGGGNGAVSLNKVLAEAAPLLLEAGWTIMHLTGKLNFQRMEKRRQGLPAQRQSRWIIKEFAAMPPCLLAADLVLCRTSATTLQECANAKKTVIGVPSPHLSDQKTNADYFESNEAIVQLEETSLTGEALAETIASLWKDKKHYSQLASQLYHKFAKPNASAEIAKLLLK